MAADPDWIEELFSAFGPVRLKRMFSGHGVYSGDFCVGLMLGAGSLCLRCDDRVRSDYEALGARPFVYEKQGKMVTVGAWWVMPDSMLDEPDEVARWARVSLDIARSLPPKKKRAGKPRVEKPRATRSTAKAAEKSAKRTKKGA